jgi:putative sterol carrier protein
MPPRRRVPVADGRAAVERWRQDGAATERAELATAVRYTLEELAAVAPGRSVEVRVPPFGAVQCVTGTTHTRGTPPNVVETDGQTWLAVATGDLGWQEAWDSGRLRVSGHRADLTAYLPLVPPRSR